ncbi:pentatricopeptide repeat-containing protein MRL1, chloroplastic isoform X1 [Hordeum vulgare subsp. vulgare]|uniref:PROP1-like PPR domain-containing protein n=2 Tax=Hordeum vulgare subsp. vulgare TaxID=112509 RepID=A0A8I6WNZ1_HORVV|nr:pentatricopeptide repeat-containing protein MRL1, chloroplastic isoform X1 [Hordeum vulgare subsp. vulgare]
MEISASASTPQALTLLTCPPCFPSLHPSARRHGRAGGGGLLLRPPPQRRFELGYRARRPVGCSLSGSSSTSLDVLGGSVVAAAALLAALQLVWLRWRGAMHRESPEVLHTQDKSIVNKALGITAQSVHDCNYSHCATHENSFSEPSVSGGMIIHELDCRASISSIYAVNKTTQVVSVTNPGAMLHTLVDVSRQEVGCSTSAEKTNSTENVMDVLATPHFGSPGQHKSKYVSNRIGCQGGLSYQFLSLSELQKDAQNGNGLSDSQTNSNNAHLLRCQQSNDDENIDLTSLSSFKRTVECPTNFVPQASIGNLVRPRKAIEFADSYVGGSHLTPGKLALFACSREGHASKQQKAVKDHDDAKTIGWSISDILNKENLDNFIPATTAGLNGIVDTSDYMRRYKSSLMDGRLKDCVDLLESMEQKGLLDMQKLHHASFLSACKKQRAVMEAVRFCRLIENPKMSTFNMLLSVCANSKDFEGALQVMVLLKEAGLKPDCKLYTTLISTCAKCGKVDAMFEVFHEMVSAGIEPNVNTYGALIDGCAKAGQVAKAFGAYGIMSSKKVKPDRVVFNALISACGESGAVARAFDVLSEMTAESSESKGCKPILPDHVTVGALMKTCIQAGQADRAREVYKMLQEYSIKGTPEVYTIALRSCSLTGDLGFALKIYEDMNKIGVQPDEMFLSALVDVAGHARRADAAFEIIKDVRAKGFHVGIMAYSSCMGACCNAKDWKKALQLFEEIKAIKLIPTVPMMNALITSLCDNDQVIKSAEVLNEIRELGVRPNEITYSVLCVACERNGEAQLALDLFEQLKVDGIGLNPTIVGCLTGLCLQMFSCDLSLGNIIVRFNQGKPQIDNKWTSSAIMVFRQAITAGLLPSSDVLSQVLGCLRFPHDSSLKNTFIYNMGISCDMPHHPNTNSLLEGFGEYDIRAFSVLEEAGLLGAVASTSTKYSQIVIDARKSNIYTAEVSLLTTLKSLKHRLAAGARLPNVTILLPTEKKQVDLDEREKTLKLAGRVGQAVGSLLRRLGIKYQGEESHGRMRINGLTLRRWFNPKFTSAPSTGAPAELLPLPSRLAKGIADQQRDIRSLSL